VKVGELYQYNGRLWGGAEPGEPWLSHLALYLGEDPIHRPDGITIVNHKFIVGGAVLLTDKTFLKYMKEIENEN
jgi:hypothetical protein